MKKFILAAVVAMLCLPFVAQAQMTQITATGLHIGSNLIATGTVCATAVDANNNPINVAISGGGLWGMGSACANVASGVITTAVGGGTYSLPDATLSQPTGLGYVFTVTDTQVGSITKGQKFQLQNVPGVTGSSFALDHYFASSTLPTAAVFSFTTGSGAPSGSCSGKAFYQNVATPSVPVLYQCSSDGAWHVIAGSGGSTPTSTAVKYASLLSVTPIAAIVAGSSSTGAVDNASAFNSALSSGITRLVVDGKYAVGSTLKVPSNVSVECTPGSGFIELLHMDAPLFMNATAATTPTSCAANVSDGLGGGGFVVGHTCDSNITIKGCTLNFNSAQSVTNGDDKTAPSGLWIPGIQMLGVQNLNIQDNILNDAPTYSIAVNNIQNGNFTGNSITATLSGGLPVGKNTDGVHINGPANALRIANNFGVTGDDFIALNADDGYRTGTGDGNGAHVAFPGWTWGPITDVTIEGNHFIGAYAAIRLLSVGSLVDRIHILNNWGTTNDIAMQIDTPYSSGAGTPNFGYIDVDGFDVQRGTETNSGFLSSIFVNGNFKGLYLNRLNYSNAKTNFPYFLQGSGTIGSLSIRGLNIQNASGTQNTTSLIQTNGNATRYDVSGINWLDGTSNTGSLLGGTSVPVSVAVSNFSGPNRLLLTGYVPSFKNGDAFTNTYPSGATTYLSTVFNEASSGATLAGTMPATTVSSHPWAVSAGGAWTYGTSGVIASGAGSSFATVDIGVATNYTMTAHLAAGNTASQLIFRYTDPNNYSVIDLNSVGPVSLVGVVAGGSTSVATSSCTPGIPTTVVLTVAGNVVTATVNGTCAVSETMTDTSNFGATKVGINNVNGSQSTVDFTSLVVTQ